MTAAVWEATARYIECRTGLAFPKGRHRILEDGVARLMARDHVQGLEALLRRLESEPALLDDLVSEITVGETHFFRHPEQFAVIRDHVLPELQREVRGRPIRIWSAGAATGEEPYTLAIIAREMGIADRVRILGTDLSRHALRAARRARYRSWALRGTPDDIRNRYFQHRTGVFELDGSVRELVELRYLNLSDDVYPALSTGIWGVDLVLCRNVLIYFAPETGAAVARRLLASLSDPGWLLVGASDPVLTDWAPATVVPTAAGLAYRRPTPRRYPGDAPPLPAPVARPGDLTPESAAPPASPPLAPPVLPSVSMPLPDTPPSPAEEARERYAARDYAGAAAAAERAVRGGEEDASLWVLLIRALANLGRSREAVGHCVAAVERYPTAPELAYLEAVLLAELNRPAQAVGAARRALYLDRRFVMAYLTLGAALSRLGDRGAARRAYVNAREILSAMPPDAAVPAADGEPAGRLRLIAQAQYDLLEDAA